MQKVYIITYRFGNIPEDFIHKVYKSLEKSIEELKRFSEEELSTGYLKNEDYKLVKSETFENHKELRYWEIYKNKYDEEAVFVVCEYNLED